LQPAFKESDRGHLIKEITACEPSRIRKLDRQVPHDLETIVSKAIAKEPDRRYQRAEALAEDLRRFLGDRPILARRTSRRERRGGWGRRNPLIASFALALAAMALLVVIGSVLSAVRLGRAAEHAHRSGRNAQEQLLDSLFVQAKASRSSRRPGQRLESLKAL